MDKVTTFKEVEILTRTINFLLVTYAGDVKYQVMTSVTVLRMVMITTIQPIIEVFQSITFGFRRWA